MFSFWLIVISSFAVTLCSVNVSSLLFSTYTHNLSVGLQDAVLPLPRSRDGMKFHYTSVRWKKGFRSVAKHVTELWPHSARRIQGFWQSNCTSFLLEGDILNSYIYVTVYISIWRLTALWYALSYYVIPSAYTVARLSNSCYIDNFRVCLYSQPTAAVQDRTVFHMAYSHSFLPALKMLLVISEDM
jgi:hypothetical protein